MSRFALRQVTLATVWTRPGEQEIRRWAEPTSLVGWTRASRSLATEAVEMEGIGGIRGYLGGKIGKIQGVLLVREST